MKVCEQTVKPTALYLPHERRERLGLPHSFVWYVECPRFAGWGETLDEAIRNWRANRLLCITFRFMEPE